jgi:hypothetical protein
MISCQCSTGIQSVAFLSFCFHSSEDGHLLLRLCKLFSFLHLITFVRMKLIFFLFLKLMSLSLLQIPQEQHDNSVPKFGFSRDPMFSLHIVDESLKQPNSIQ